MYQQKNRRKPQVAYQPKGQPQEQTEEQQQQQLPEQQEINAPQPKREQHQQKPNPKYQQQQQQQYQPRQKQQQKVQYVEKGKKNELEEEEEWPEETKHQGQKQQPQRYQQKAYDNPNPKKRNPQYYPKDNRYSKYNPDTNPQQYNKRDRPRQQREKIEIDTPIPELPKKEEMLQEPDEEQLNMKINEIDEQIANIWNNYKEVEDEKWGKQGIKRTPYQVNLIEDLRQIRRNMKLKAQEKQKHFQNLKVIKEKFYEIKAKLDDQKQKVSEFSQKIKQNKNKQEIESKIYNLRQQLSNALISISDEKKLIRDIEILEASLPYADPMEVAKDEMDDIYQEKKALGKELWRATETYQESKANFEVLKAQLTEKQALLDEERQKTQQVADQQNAELNEKLKETKKQVAELRKEKQQLYKQFDTDYENYEKQQSEIKHIKWMTKQKQYLIQKEKNRQQYEEAERKRAEERKLKQQYPYQEEVDLCKLLISYCNNMKSSLLGTSNDNQQESQPQQSPEQLQKFINENKDWKKDKLTVIQHKKATNNDYFEGKQQKPKQKKKQQKAVVTDPSQIPINHKIDVLNDFEKMKIMPPMWASQLENSLKALEEKLKYFSDLNQSGADRESDNEKQEKKKEYRQDNRQERGHNQKEQKKENKKIVPKFNAGDFPDIGAMEGTK